MKRPRIIRRAGSTPGGLAGPEDKLTTLTLRCTVNQRETWRESGALAGESLSEFIRVAAEERASNAARISLEALLEGFRAVAELGLSEYRQAVAVLGARTVEAARAEAAPLGPAQEEKE